MPFASLHRFSFLKVAPLLATGALLELCSALPRAAHAQTTVNYGGMGAFTRLNTYSTGGVTATTTGTINIAPSYGLGVVGGIPRLGDSIIDSGESVLFTFDAGPVTNVSARIGAAGSSEGFPNIMEIFGTGGSSLGVFTAFGVSDLGLHSNPSLSSRVGNAAISGFRVTSSSIGNISIASITYTSAAVSAVPEPGEWATMGFAAAGLCGLMIRARRRKGSQTPSLAA